MNKKVVKITESDLNNLIENSVLKVLKESVEEDSSISQAIDKCINIIIKTECAGRGFDFRGRAMVDSDPKYNELKEELIGSMEAYFNSAKNLLSYLASVTSNDYIRNNAQKYLNKQYTPTWQFIMENKVIKLNSDEFKNLVLESIGKVLSESNYMRNAGKEDIYNNMDKAEAHIKAAMNIWKKVGQFDELRGVATGEWTMIMQTMKKLAADINKYSFETLDGDIHGAL